MASHKDYEAVAKILRKHVQTQGCESNFLVRDFIEYFKVDNSRFDPQRFTDAIYGDKNATSH